MKLFNIKQRNAATLKSFSFFLVFSFFLISSAFGQINFAPKVDYGTGAGPRWVFVADLDGDTDNDLAVPNEFSNTVSVFKNNGDGTFAPKVDYATGTNPHSVFASDLDGDTDKDLAVANHISQTVSVLKNNGDGTFAPKVDYAIGGNVVQVFASDLDGDTDNDLVVANHSRNFVSVLKNNGDGTFAALVDYGTGVLPVSVFAADLDGDTDKDLAVGNANSNTVSVLKNNGDGTLAAKVDYVTGLDPRSVFASDLDSDGDQDLAVANFSSNTVSILKNNGDGTFAAKVDYGTGTGPFSVFASDLDGDTDNDLAVANLTGGNTVSVLKNNGDGTFAPKVGYGTGTTPISVFAADLDGDTDKDLAVANHGSNTLSILINLSAQCGTWTAKAPMPTPRWGHGAAVINGKLYVVGGSNIAGEAFLTTLEVYDPSTDTWVTKAPMPSPRNRVAAAELNGQLYVVGGNVNDILTPLGTVEAYDPTSDAWTTKAPMPTPRAYLGVAVVNGILYAIGGHKGFAGDQTMVEAYDPVTNTWTPKAPLPLPLRHHEAAAIGGKIYVPGGQCWNASFVYDPGTDTWVTKAPVPWGEPVVSYGLAVVNSKLYVMGGIGCASGVLRADVWEYNPLTDTWTSRAPLPAPRSDIAAGQINGKIYAVGGFTGPPHSTNPVATNEEFSPLEQGALVLDPIGPKTVAEGSLLTFRVLATLCGGGALTLTATNIPANATFIDNGNGSGSFAFNPDCNQAGSYNVTFVASSGGQADSETVTITVTDVAVALESIGPRAIPAGSNLTFRVHATGCGILTLSATNLPLNATFVDSGNGSGSFQLNPDCNQVGVHNVTFKASDAQSSDSEVVQITVIGQGFARVDYGTGEIPFSVFAVDLDGDVDKDLAVANFFSNTVSVLKNNGDGTFAPKVDYGTGVRPRSVFASDLDGDGDQDLVVSNFTSITVSVLKNNGDGTFAPKVDYVTGSRPRSVFVSDLDGDGDQDLATANSGGTVSILMNNGDGTFAAKVDYATGTSPFSLVASDLDGDLDQDLAVTKLFSNTVSILKNNGDGTFAASVDYGTGDIPRVVFASDLDGDADKDLAVANTGSNTVSILKNNGDGTFAVNVDYGTGTSPFSVVASDLDGDGDQDLAVANAGDNSVSLLLNNSDGTFAAATDFGTGDAPTAVFAADLDGNGARDLVTANQGSNTVSVLLQSKCQPVVIQVGSVAGRVFADCPSPNTGLLGVKVDAFKLGSGDLAGHAVTYTNGNYRIDSLPAGDYTITILTPLGYTAVSEEMAATVAGGAVVNVDFSLSCVTITANPRTIGFWKHQVAVALGKRGTAQIDAATLCQYLDLIEVHFNSNQINQVIVYQPPDSGFCIDKLVVARNLLNLSGSVAMISRARQQLMALLLNIAAGFISQTQVVSADGAKVSQAVTYCDNLIDDTAGDHEKAKTIADLINNNQQIPAGVIPLSTVQIAYSIRAKGTVPQKFDLLQNFPNPFNATTTIFYDLPKDGEVQLVIYNIMGRKVKTLLNQRQPAGLYQLVWDGKDESGNTVASGVYFYRLKTEAFVTTKRMTLLK